MNRGSNLVNQFHQLLDSSMGTRRREEAKEAEPQVKTIYMIECQILRRTRVEWFSISPPPNCYSTTQDKKEFI